MQTRSRRQVQQEIPQEENPKKNRRTALKQEKKTQQTKSAPKTDFNKDNLLQLLEESVNTNRNIQTKQLKKLVTQQFCNLYCNISLSLAPKDQNLINEYIDQLEQEYIISKRSTNIHLNKQSEIQSLIEKKKLESADDDLSEVDDTEMKLVTTKVQFTSVIKNNQRNLNFKLAMEKESYLEILQRKPQVKRLKLDWNIGHFHQEFNQFRNAIDQCKQENQAFGRNNGKLLDLKINAAEYIQRWSKVNGRRQRYARQSLDEQFVESLQIIPKTFVRLRYLHLNFSQSAETENFQKNLGELINQCGQHLSVIEEFVFKVNQAQNYCLLELLEEFEKGETINNRKCKLFHIFFTQLNEILRTKQDDQQQMNQDQEQTMVEYDKIILQFPYQTNEKNNIHKFDSIINRASQIKQLELELKENQLDQQTEYAIQDNFLKLVQSMQTFTELTSLKLKIRCSTVSICDFYPDIDKLTHLKYIFITLGTHDDKQDELLQQQLPQILTKHKKSLEIKLKQNELNCYTLYIQNIKNVQQSQQIQYQDDKLIIQLNNIQTPILTEIYNITLLILENTPTKSIRIIATKFNKKKINSMIKFFQFLKTLLPNIPEPIQLELQFNPEEIISEEENEEILDFFKKLSTKVTHFQLFLTQVPYQYYQQFVQRWINGLIQTPKEINIYCSFGPKVFSSLPNAQLMNIIQVLANARNDFKVELTNSYFGGFNFNDQNIVQERQNEQLIQKVNSFQFIEKMRQKLGLFDARAKYMNSIFREEDINERIIHDIIKSYHI